MTTSSLGRLTLDLAVRLSEFTDGMSRAERETAERTRNMQESITSFREHLANELGGTQLGSIIDSFNERFGSVEGSITKVGAAFAGIAVGGIAVGIGALSKMAIEAAKADATMVVLANRANIAVESFQVLEKASVGLGVTQDQLGSIMADLQEKLGEFSATEGGGAADFFDALRNNTKMTDDQIKAFSKTLQGKDGVEAVQLLKNKLDELGASSQEQRFVFESLASDLTNLMPLFANGGKLLGEYGEALRDAGVIKTKEAIEQSQLLAAQTQSVQQRFDGFKSQLAGAMMPVLNTLAQHFLKGGEKASGFGGIIQGVGIIAKGVAAVILTFSTVVGAMGNTIGATLAQLANVATTAINVWNADGLAAKAVAIAQGFGNAKNLTVDWFTTTMDSLKAADKTMGDLVNGQTLASDKLTQANLAMMKSQNAQTAGIRTNAKEAEANAKAKENLAKAEARLVAITGNSGRGTGPHLDIRKSGGGRALTAAELARFEVNGRSLSSYKQSSGYGGRTIFGKYQFHKGQDYAFGVGTPVTSKVPIKDVKTWWDSKGGGLVSTVLFADGLSVDLLHQAPQAKHAVKRGSSNIGDGAKISDQLIAADEKYQSEAQREAEQAEKERQRQLEQDAKDRLSLAEKYYTEEQRINAENEKNMAEINRLYVRGTKEYHDALVLENERYLKAYSEYEWKLGEKARAQKALIDKIREDIGNSTMQSTNDYLDASMKASMSPEQYNRWSLQRDYNNQYSSLYGQYENRQNEINATDERGNFRIDDETERNALLEQARQEHLAKLYVMEADFAAKVTDLDKQQAEARSATISGMFGSMTDAAASFFGEQSAMYKVAFAMEKAYAVYKAVMNIQETYSNTFNAVSAIPVIGPYIAAPMAAAASAIQVAQAAKLKGMQAPSVAGIAHGGLDYVPSESTFLLDQGERVLSPRQNKDLTKYLNDRKDAQGGDIYINNNSSAQVSAQRNPDGTVTVDVVDKMIKQSWSRVGQANSHESRQIQKYTTARFNRQ